MITGEVVEEELREFAISLVQYAEDQWRNGYSTTFICGHHPQLFTSVQQSEVQKSLMLLMFMSVYQVCLHSKIILGY